MKSDSVARIGCEKLSIKKQKARSTTDNLDSKIPQRNTFGNFHRNEFPLVLHRINWTDEIFDTEGGSEERSVRTPFARCSKRRAGCFGSGGL